MVRTGRGKQEVKLLKNERHLYASLYVAVQSRKVDLDAFFENEQHKYPVALSEMDNYEQQQARQTYWHACR